MSKDVIEILEKETFEESDTYETPPPDVVAYTEARSCADLYRMYSDGTLNITPTYEREIVWKDTDQTRFIDSLIKQLPIPSMCFSYDNDTQQFQVIDGLQRTATIVRFLKGSDWNLSKLKDIEPKISGQDISKFKEINSDLHSYYKRIQNLTLPVTILRCDYSKKSHANYIFMIFHRLNHGGSKLNNQEIRNCIYGGSFNDLLKELNANPDWMRINNMKRTIGYRFMKEEIILRVFALHDSYRSYNGRLSKFLNDYMSNFRRAEINTLQEKRALFNRSVSIVDESIFGGKAPHKLPTTILEATLVGVSHNLDYLEKQTPQGIKNMYARLLEEDEFSEEKLREGLSGKERVIGRIEASIKVFSKK